MTQPFPHLFQPIQIGRKQSRNRIMRLATTSNSGEYGLATDHTIAVYRRMARGGTGVIVSEGTRVHGSNTRRVNVGALLLYSEQVIPGLARVAQAVQAEGALFVVQLNHGGRQNVTNTPTTSWAPSAIACPHSGGIPHQMTKAEIAEVVAGFAKAALHAKQAGCDGVEIHGGQGHLIQEFVSAFSNQRSDEYGGSLENRLRFASEIISSVREKAGPDFIVGYRMGYEEFTPGGITLQESKQAAALLKKLGMIDYVSLTQGNFNSIDTHCPDSHYGPLPYIALQAQMKAAFSAIPVVASTFIKTPEQAEDIVAQGKADLVGMCRALIADPEWPLKAMQGRSEDIRRCISCCQCWGSMGRVSCTINPTIGNELELPPLGKVAAPKRIVIVGGGPAGLEAAHVAAQRGHSVVLFEKKAELGGKLAGSRRFLGHHDVWHAVDYLSRQALKSGAKLCLGTEIDAARILAERPDTVIVAAGADVVTPTLAGDRSIPVFAYEGEIPANLPDGDVAVMDEDGYYWAAALTEALARQGRKVVYFTRFTEPLRELPKISRISTLRVLDELGVQCFANMHVDRAERGALVIRHYYNAKRETKLEGIAALVWLGVQRANDGLVSELRAAGVKDVHLIGDAYAPRRLANAISEGHRTARTVS